MTLSERQKKADAIARELRKHFKHDEVSVENSLPLRDDEQLRIKVVDQKRNEFVETTCGWGRIPSYVGVSWRTSAITHGLVPAAVWEIRLEHERQPIPDRKIYGEVEERKKTDLEVEAVRRHLGLRT